MSNQVGVKHQPVKSQIIGKASRHCSFTGKCPTPGTRTDASFVLAAFGGGPNDTLTCHKGDSFCVGNALYSLGVFWGIRWFFAIVMDKIRKLLVVDMVKVPWIINQCNTLSFSRVGFRWCCWYSPFRIRSFFSLKMDDLIEKKYGQLIQPLTWSRSLWKYYVCFFIDGCYEGSDPKFFREIPAVIS